MLFYGTGEAIGMIQRETDENLCASPRESMHLDSGGLTHSSENYPIEVYLTVDLAKGLTESRLFKRTT